MSALSVITLLLNGLTLALALGFLLIILWHDVRKELNQFFSIFLFLVTFWNAGALLSLGVSLVDPRTPVLLLATSIMELGFTGSSVAVYTLTALLVGVHTKRFRLLALASLFLVLCYQLFLIVNVTTPISGLTENGFLQYRFQPLSAVFYFAFDGLTFYLLWRYGRKIRSSSLHNGLTLFALGQSLGFLNPSLGAASISINVCSIATLIISFSLLRQQIITSLGERITQLEAIHKVSLAITSQISLDTVLTQIATQAVNWLNADAAGIFLAGAEGLELATVYNLPQSYLHRKIPFGEGVVGTVAQTRQSVYLENYNRDWKRESDLPLARETFGAVIAVPLIYRDQAIGVLMVVAGRQGRLFSGEDVEALELLAAQAAVAIAHSRLFAEQVKLGLQVETARSQLETVLSSTENPVIAVDRRFRLIFANPAARSLLPLEQVSGDTRVISVLPPDILPSSLRVVLRRLRYDRAYTYEVSINGRVYLCHLAQLGRPGIAGWVAILNDVTQLKELDRLKSEMVRMTSHDLKNPLQAAMANLELLRDDLAGESDREIQVSLHEIGKQLNRMNRIIGGILDLERIKTGKLQMEMCDPLEVIQNALDELRRFAQEREIALQTEVESTAPCFMADVEQFERALINLVENAIKFTSSGGRVVIRSRRDRENVLFEVEDNGIGIPESLQSQVFERFLRGGQRGQPGAENISGSGLGLSLVKAVVENHHGRIWLRSKVGEGTTFFISLPAVPESTA